MSTDDDREKAVGEDDCVEPEPTGDAEPKFDFQTELEEAFPQKPIKVLGSGAFTQSEAELPTQQIENDPDAPAPPFLHETQICIADTSRFVLRDETWGFVWCEWPAKAVKRTPNGSYRAKWVDADKWKDGTDPHGRASVDDQDADLNWVRVEPIRPECKFYLRQLLPPAPSLAMQGYDKGDMHRYCTVRRSVAGAFLTLKDGAMKACSFRDPPNERSDEALDDFDTTLIGKSRDRVNLPMFNLVTEQILGKLSTNGDRAS